ncbi:MAG: helix-turn-helix domain-containing protein [Candidatus Eremiobacteraeota bacterium]|nr:helix-turn-helix domain-containing protein [Candidatus Eremiobacteraeota bacterium]
MRPLREANLDFGALLKQFRARAGLSQQMLADRALISVQAVSALERGYRKVPYRETLERLADALGLDDRQKALLELSARKARGIRALQRTTWVHNNLPRQLTPLVGRESVVKTIAQLVTEVPLVSIVGPGGVGKTRASIAVAERLLDAFGAGACFVDFAPLTEFSSVEQTIAGALRVQETGSGSLLQTLCTYLAEKQLLILLDNCEHVVGDVRRIAGALLRECPRIAVLTTSREPVQITGEHVYRIPPLDVPRSGEISPEEALSYGAVALFAERVSSADARYELQAPDVAPIVQICRTLDGLPLAIELAAARATALSPSEISARLNEVFTLLQSGGHGVPRHETMRAVIDWSYALLSNRARALFDRLSIFSGGFTLGSATAVCADGDLAADDIFDALTSLIAQSLVMTEFAGGASRYRLLEVTRQYALDRLELRGERHAAARRHLLACVSLAERLDREWYTADESAWFAAAQADLDNCRAALRWAIGQRYDPAGGCRLTAALARVWYSLAPSEGRRWTEAALEADSESSDAVRALLYIATAELSAALGEYAPSLRAAERALSLRDACDDVQVARSLQAAGSARSALGDVEEGEDLLDEALEIARRLRNARLEALVLGDLGTARSRAGDVDGARALYAQALSLYLELHLERPAASIAGNLAEVQFAAGDAAAALQRANEALIGHERTHNPRSAANDLGNMAAYSVALDRFDDARSYAAQALSIALEVKATVLTLYILQHLAAAGALQPRSSRCQERAAVLLGYVDSRLESLNAGREYTERQEYQRILAALQDRFGDELAPLLARGATWNTQRALAAAADL